MKKELFISVFLCVYLFAAVDARVKVEIDEDISVKIVSAKSSSVSLYKGGRTVSGPLIIENNGTDPFNMSLSLDNESPWDTASSAADGEVAVFAVFASQQPSSSDFKSDDVLSGTYRTATMDRFARSSDSKGVKGIDVPAGSRRNIYFRIDAPTDTSYIKKAYDLNINIKITIAAKDESVIDQDGGRLEIDDGLVLDIPSGALKDSTSLTARQVSTSLISRGSGLAENVRAVAGFEILPSGTVFRKPCRLKLYYDEDEISSGTEDDLGLFFWDGFEWRLVGNTVDKKKNTITGSITHLSLFAVFPMAAEPSYGPAEKIITPATADGVNDSANFDGLAGMDVKINIYDVAGKRVRTINVSRDGNTWRGYDDNGNIVESGVYIYQFKVEGEYYTGTITVAK
ncbi:MAG: gliding motility-associated C-terminal domain-containing protein [Elusimicrobia bacterium]|nr:gliding motility-associated C-terminal domain-containing protein [Elusimicrobiota bacterium]